MNILNFLCLGINKKLAEAASKWIGKKAFSSWRVVLCISPSKIRSFRGISSSVETHVYFSHVSNLWVTVSENIRLSNNYLNNKSFVLQDVDQSFLCTVVFSTRQYKYTVLSRYNRSWRWLRGTRQTTLLCSEWHYSCSL